MVEPWVEEYIGIPFRDRGRGRDGADCWGLVRLVLAERYGILTPSAADDYSSATRDRRLTAELLRDNREAGEWLEVEAGLERTGDVALLRTGLLPCHVGLVVAGGGWMLHTERGVSSHLGRYRAGDCPRWGGRAVGFYRHGEMKDV